MEFEHVSVLLEETLQWLAPRDGGVYVDGTLGGGGHSARILAACAPHGHLYGIDRDADAIAAATERLGDSPCFTAIRGNFHDVRELLAQRGVEQIDGMLLDLGVSSHQLDTESRGFPYHGDAPLDMRMDQRQTLTAGEIVNMWPEREIARILSDYGEEKWAARIAQIICEHRARGTIATTADLVRCVDAAIPKKIRMREEGHSARRTFQALRIAVNDELAPLTRALEDAVGLLAPGGRLCVITFHSLEDRIVKHTMRRLQNPCTCPPKAPVCTCGKRPVARVLTGGGVQPGAQELARNPRARSARLRACEKL